MRERTCVHLWLIHDDVWQKPTQSYKAIIFQKKIFNINVTLIRKKMIEVRSTYLKLMYYLTNILLV